ncbi:MAG: hypothetical protein PWR26_198 [Methanosarcinales archaeon]|nr:MAG: hypothetical protein XD46_0794 [Euryarchaeota archaeon 55_53]KUK30103.1 MAG: hypothetical protein XD62_0825 [Methanosarcinales archeaon 56_1174]MDI3487481.1 hypothetical protein [Methanosarcinales archaeon]
MRISLGLSSRMPLTSYAAIARKVGLDGIWVGEHVDAPLDERTLVELSDAVPELPLGTAIMSIYVHGIEELVALGMRMSSHFSGFSLGLGVGDIPSLKRRGIVPERPIRRMAHYIEQLSALREQGVRILLGSTGKGMLQRLSYEVDGVVLTGPVEHLRDVVGLCPGERVFWGALWLDEPCSRYARVSYTTGHDVLIEPERLAAQLEQMGIHEVIVGPPHGDDVEGVVRVLAERLRAAP